MEQWLLQLNAGDVVRGWELFVAAYHLVVTAAIARVLADPDDVMDVFGQVCEKLRSNDCARLRRVV